MIEKPVIRNKSKSPTKKQHQKCLIESIKEQASQEEQKTSSRKKEECNVPINNQDQKSLNEIVNDPNNQKAQKSSPRKNVGRFNAISSLANVSNLLLDFFVYLNKSLIVCALI